jgi:glycosyltransferase involved in cell wall biosynthesis
MKQTLILIINDYPYNIGEPFFESEIIELSKRFEQILLFSVVGKKHETMTRTAPPNVTVIPLGCSHNKFRNIFSGLFFHLSGANGSNLKTRAMDYYFRGKAKTIAAKINKALKNYSISKDVIIYSYWLTLGLSALLLKKKLVNEGKTVRLVSRAHGYDIYSELMPAGYYPYLDLIVAEEDYIGPCSDYGTNYLRNKFPQFVNKIFTHRLGTIDHLKSFKIKTNKSKKNFVTCSGLRPVKRLDLFANAFCLAAEKDNEIKWFIIGDGPEKRKIQAIISKNHMEQRVTFLGNITNDNVYNFYKTIDISFFANVSISEGIPVSIMEAISFGIPILATNVGGNKEIVSCLNGKIIDKDVGTDELSQVIVELATMKDNDYQELSKNSRQIWEHLYDATHNYEKWISVIKGDSQS